MTKYDWLGTENKKSIFDWDIFKKYLFFTIKKKIYLILINFMQI